MTKNISNKPPLKVAISQRFLTGYREDLFYEVSLEADLDLKVFFGDRNAKKHEKFSSITRPPRFPHKRLKTLSAVFPGMGHLNQLFFSPGILWALIRFRPDVVLTEGTSNIANNLLICPYCWLTGTPYIWWDLGKIRGQESENPFRKKLYPLIRFLYRRAAGIFAYSQFAKDFFIQQGIDANKIVVSRNTVRVERFWEGLETHQVAGAVLKSSLGFQDKLVFLAVGGMEGGKRFDLLVTAFQKLSRSYNNIALLLVGDGEEKTALLKQANGDPNIYLAGAQYKDIAHYFAAGSVMVMPGLGGLALNEAMAFGLPVIAGPADGTELDLVLPGKTGFLIGRNASEELVEKMKWCIENQDKLTEMGALALNHIRQGYTLRHMVAALRQSIAVTLSKRFLA